MSTLQKALDALQPYVIGIRYLEGLPIIDVVFKEGWTVPESTLISKIKGDNGLNYYMIFSEKDGIGLDELLEYVDTTIKGNIEREKKHQLLKEKVNELKEFFKKNSLNRLKNLKFVIGDDDFITELNDLELNNETVVEEPKTDIVETNIVKENIDLENLSDEEKEILEEELRAENFKKFKESQKNNTQLEIIKNKIELPPKKTINSSLQEIEESCDCGPEEACSKCIDKKTI